MNHLSSNQDSLNIHILSLFSPQTLQINLTYYKRFPMGNCFTRGTKTWAVDDEWGQVEPVSPSVDTGSTVVKIKLTKKQLEEILGKAGVGSDQNLPIELLLKHVMNKGCEESLPDRNRNWRPVLHTIPEAAE